MGGVKCSICNRLIDQTDTVVRVVAEIAKRDPEVDGDDVMYFSKVLEWESFVTMHLGCAREKVMAGAELPYGEEVGDLALFEKEFDPVVVKKSMLRVVRG